MLKRGRDAWFDLPLMWKGMIVISIPLACVLFSFVNVRILQAQRDDLRAWIQRAFQAGSRIQAIATLLVNAENGVRGFALTRNPEYLEPYHRAERELVRRLSSLKTAVQGSASQLSRIERIESLSRERLSVMRSLTTPAAPAAIAHEAAEAERLETALNREFDAMRMEEAQRWTSQIAAESELRGRLTLAALAATFFSLLGGIVAMMLFISGVVRRLELLRQNAQRLACGETLADLPRGEDEIGELGACLKQSSELLAEREHELLTLNEDLDRRVKERTGQLELETSERKRTEDQLRQVQKMEAIGRLAGGVAHDFNNVLTIIIGNGELLRSRAHADPEIRQRLGDILQASEHAVSLTRQLLAFSRRQLIQPKALDLNTVVTRMDKLLRRLIGEDIELRTNTTAKLEHVCVDEGQLEQVIINLAVNARDAMPKGGKLTIQTGSLELDESYCKNHVESKPGRHVMLAVSDSGTGMTPEVQARLFEPFFTTKEKGRGTGLGLATIYGIVKQNGGSIWVYSEVGIGSTFKIYFPAVSGAPVIAFPERKPVAIERDSGTILLVEDEPSVRRMTRDILLRYGYTVLDAATVSAAFRLSQEHPALITLLLTDVIMPGSNGRELASKLRQDRPSMKVLYMSGYTDDAIAHHGVLEAGTPFIEKPFTPEGLAAKVREVIGR